MGKPVNKTLRIAAMSAGEEIGHVSGPIVTFRGNAAPLRSLLVSIDPVQAGTGDPSPDNVRPISGWTEAKVWVKPTYDPTADPTATIQLGQTYYGGTLDVKTGVLTVDRAMVDLGDFTWLKSGSGTGRFYCSPGQEYLPYKFGQFTDMLCSGYDFDGYGDNAKGYYGANGTLRYFYHAGSPFARELYVVDEAKATMTAADFTTAMSGVQLVYELATPITIPLTPQEISTLAGQNVVWADTGDVDVKYTATGGEGGKLALLLRNRKELLIALRKGLTPAEAGLLNSTPLLGGFVRPGLSTDDEKEEDELL